MTDRQALLAAIRTHPDEDTPRLAFADWLDEQGGKPNQFQADFIRTSCRLDNLDPWDEAWLEVRTHHEKLLRKIPEAWTNHLKGRAVRWWYERGFVGHITVYSKRFVTEGGKFFDDDPIRLVKFVKLTSARATVRPAELFDCPHLARASALNFDGSDLKDKDLERLAASPHTAGLRELHLGAEQSFTRAGLPKLLAARPGVKELRLARNTAIKDAHLRDLAACPALAHLTLLDLTNVNGSAAALGDLLNSPHAANLKSLSIAPALGYDEEHGHTTGYARDRAGGLALAEAIAGAKALPNLRELDLTGRSLGNDGLAALGEARLPALLSLNVSENLITKRGVAAFATTPLAKRLRLIRFQGNGLDAHSEAFAKLFPNARILVSFERL